MNLPNLLTMLRFGLVPVYWIVFFSDSPYSMQGALIVLLLAGATDLLDGYLARKFKWVTQLGIMLDPLADKLMMVSVMLAFLIDNRISWLAAALLIVRDLGMIVFSIVFVSRGKKTVPASVWGKVTTVLYYFVLVALLFQWPYANVYVWGMILFAFITSLTYLRQIRAINL